MVNISDHNAHNTLLEFSIAFKSGKSSESKKFKKRCLKVCKKCLPAAGEIVQTRLLKVVINYNNLFLVSAARLGYNNTSPLISTA